MLVATTKHYEYQWQIGLDWPAPSSCDEAIIKLYASNDELVFIRNNFRNIPDVEVKFPWNLSNINNEVVWFGDMAAFIGHNLIKLLQKKTEQDDMSEKENQEKKDVHTEHCCQKCGCKYGNDCCSVVTGYRKQSIPCGGNDICDSDILY